MRVNEELLLSIRQIFRDACTDLFDSLNCDVVVHEMPVKDLCHVPVATIDAGSEELEMMLVLRMPHEVLAMTYPELMGDITVVTDEQLEDWISELSNMLIGRLKSKFLRHDCAVMIGLPVSYFGGEMDGVSLSASAHEIIFQFEVNNEICEYNLNVEIFSDHLDFSIEEDESVELCEEGSLELF